MATDHALPHRRSMIARMFLWGQPERDAAGSATVKPLSSIGRSQSVMTLVGTIRKASRRGVRKCLRGWPPTSHAITVARPRW